MEKQATDANLLDHEHCYRALLARDQRFDGQFFTAVHSTGIYCRSICPARTPSSKGVTFFISAAGASQAGYRPCLRCRPELAPAERYWNSQDAITDRLSRLVAEGQLDQIGLPELAAQMGYSERHLRRLYTTRWGVNLVEAAQVRRLHLAKQLLQDSNLSITEVATASGFNSLRRFNALIKARWGVTPSVFRKQGRRASNAKLGATDGGMGKVVLRLQTRSPYDWSHLLGFLRGRQLPSVEWVDDNSYSRVIRFKSAEGIVVVGTISVNRHSEKELRAELSDSLLPHLAQILPRLRRLFDLDANPDAIGTALAASKDIYPLWQRWPGTRVPGVWAAFEVAVRAVLGQQVSVKAARTLVTRFVARFGEPLPESMQTEQLTHCFPEPEQLIEANFDGLGITGRRIETIKALAASFANGELDFVMGDPMQQRERLLAIKGIGPWTVEYMAMRGLGDPDAFPAGDLILRRGLKIGHEYSEKQIEQLSQAWRPWRAYTALLLWRHYVAEVLEQE